mmetsp:Transcript_95124/g.268742  ORF Transcript_95124/g.268742 Transcript_95124/m.268742 type:complete len:112 (+) Transcript_95124:226-561(+)
MRRPVTRATARSAVCSEATVIFSEQLEKRNARGRMGRRGQHLLHQSKGCAHHRPRLATPPRVAMAGYGRSQAATFPASLATGAPCRHMAERAARRRQGQLAKRSEGASAQA